MILIFLVLDAVYSEKKAVSWKKHIKLAEHNRFDEPKQDISCLFRSVTRSFTKYITVQIKLSLHFVKQTRYNLFTSQCNLWHKMTFFFFFYNLGQGNNYCSWMNCEATFISDWSSPVTTQAGEAETPAHAHVQLWPGWRTRRPAGTGTAGSRPGRKSCWTQRQGKPERAP